MLKGIDISKWNRNPPVCVDFAVIRATHGVAVDKYAKTWAGVYADKLIGFYHFAKTNYDWLASAKKFIETVKASAGGASCFLALDIEGIDANRPNAVKWVRNWLSYVIRTTGIKPLLYTNSANITKFSEVMKDLDVGLWVAHWDVKKPKIEPLKTWAMWQYSTSNNTLDLDYFNGSKEQLKKYMGKV